MSAPTKRSPASSGIGEAPDAGARTAGLRRAANTRTANAEKAADAAIRDLLKRGATINFAAVARVAGVSRAFLHRHPELSDRIHALNVTQSEALSEERTAAAIGESAIVAALRRKLHEEQTRHREAEKDLRARVRELEQQVAALYGELGRSAEKKRPHASESAANVAPP